MAVQARRAIDTSEGSEMRRAGLAPLAIEALSVSDYEVMPFHADTTGLSPGGMFG